MKPIGYVAAMMIALAGCGCSGGPDREKLCRAIGETPALALQPRDHLYWDENCADYRLKLLIGPDPAETAARRAATPASTPCTPRSAGKIWSGPCRQDNECSSCRCEKGHCAVPEQPR